MIVVIPLCNKDGNLCIKSLEWQRDLDPKIEWDCLLAVDESTQPDLIRKATELSKSTYRNVIEFRYPKPPIPSWPAAPNHVWQNVARFIAYFRSKFKDQPWLFLEPDAIPIRSGWWSDIEKAYFDKKKPFMGHVVNGMGHLTGVAVYPPSVSDYLSSALMVTNAAWDVVLGKELNDRGAINDLVYNNWKLFQHVWAMGPDFKPTNDSSFPVPTFSDFNTMLKWVDLEAAIFHRNKDGTLIDWLRFKNSSKRNVPDLTGTTHAGPAINEIRVVAGEESVSSPSATGSIHQGSSQCAVVGDDAGPGTSRVTVVQPPGVDAEPARRDASSLPDPIYKGRAEILIVTYHKDKPWLDYSLRSIRKYLKGFSGITLVVPTRDQEVFREMVRPYPEVTMHTFQEQEGKGMLHHMVQICSADLWCPRADIVVHIDPDCIFHTPTSVDEYVVDGKPVMLRKSYKKLLEEKSDCYQWKAVTERALLFETDVYTMCRHPSCHPIHIYKKLRRYIAKVQQKPFDYFVLNGRNEFPQTFAEFPTLGAFGWEKSRYDYHWINIDKEKAPADRQKTYWSHGGITAEIREEIEGWLS